MTEYALTKDGVTIADIRDLPQRPADPAGKVGWYWLAVQRTTAEGSSPDLVSIDLQAGTVSITHYEPAPTPQPSGEAIALIRRQADDLIADGKAAEAFVLLYQNGALIP